MAGLWNPDQLLNITGRGVYGKIQCSGLNKGVGPRCGFQKPTGDPDSVAVHRLLPTLAARPLSGITHEDLIELAELCLCRDWHFRQKQRVACAWQAKIAQALSQQQQSAAAPPRLGTPEPIAPEPLGAFGMPTPPSTQTSSRNTSFTFESPPPPALGLPTSRDSSDRHALAALRKDLDDVREQLAAAVRENTMLQGVERHLKEAASAETQARVLAEAELASARDQLRHAATQREDLERECVRDAQSLKAALSLSAELRRDLSERERLREENAALGQQLRSLQAALDTSEKHVSHLQSKLLDTEAAGAGRELVLIQKPDGRASWLHRVRGWFGRLKPGNLRVGL
ncbi:hypothetical protein B0T25DRAFT_550992 [Lasiosphaeria hispida]|uniref:Uncharacterized protein n=1 Tax=Lasiosphaeria hispida TaxID=260671 RepID=A0AAJ0HBC7_9PEZI|nr:hypothetical protein B0T25DRAFT_550992 [Lasiosphaeria hispida]